MVIWLFTFLLIYLLLGCLFVIRLLQVIYLFSSIFACPCDGIKRGQNCHRKSNRKTGRTQQTFSTPNPSSRFFLAVFRAVPQLNERLKRASW